VRVGQLYNGSVHVVNVNVIPCVQKIIVLVGGD